jgi:hypothetical protein
MLERLTILEDDAAGIVMDLAYLTSMLEGFAGNTPFVHPRTGLTVTPEPMPTHLYVEIAKVAQHLDVILRDGPSDEWPDDYPED